MTDDAKPLPDLGNDYWMNLGRRALACKHWRWMPGMLAQHRDDFGRSWARILSVGTWGVVQIKPSEGTTRNALSEMFASDHIPDLRDPATLGCLVALVEEALGCHVAAFAGSIARWQMENACDEERCYVTTTEQPTRAEALVAALEETP